MIPTSKMFFPVISTISIIYLVSKYGPVSNFIKDTIDGIYSIGELFLSENMYNNYYLPVPYTYNKKHYVCLVRRKTSRAVIESVIDQDKNPITNLMRAIAGPNLDFNGLYVTPNRLGFKSLTFTLFNTTLSVEKRVFIGKDRIVLTSKETHEMDDDVGNETDVTNEDTDSEETDVVNEDTVGCGEADETGGETDETGGEAGGGETDETGGGETDETGGGETGGGETDETGGENVI